MLNGLSSILDGRRHNITLVNVDELFAAGVAVAFLSGEAASDSSRAALRKRKAALRLWTCGGDGWGVQWGVGRWAVCAR